MKSCLHCGRDLPDDVHHLRRYCPDRTCSTAEKRNRRNSRRRGKAEPGTIRTINGRQCMWAPDHPLGTQSGWVGVKRLALYERLGGTDPACGACGTQLDWSRSYRSPDRVCAVSPPGTDEVIPLCKPCLDGVGAAGGALGSYLHPLVWAEAGEASEPPWNKGGSESPQPAAGSCEEGDAPRLADLVEARGRLTAVWAGTTQDARLLVAAATLLDLQVRRAG